jgi:hypothetical protein
MQLKLNFFIRAIQFLKVGRVAGRGGVNDAFEDCGLTIIKKRKDRLRAAFVSQRIHHQIISTKGLDVTKPSEELPQ